MGRRVPTTVRGRQNEAASSCSGSVPKDPRKRSPVRLLPSVADYTLARLVERFTDVRGSPYDVFGMIPPPGEKDGEDVHRRYATIVEGRSKGIGGETYYGYRDELLTEVTESFARHGLPIEANNVDLIQGLFEDTIELDEPVALAHLDGDWYASTMTCLTRITPLLFRFERRGRLHIVRV